MRLIAVLVFCCGILRAQVVINEILFDPAAAAGALGRPPRSRPSPLRTHQWVELYNKGSEPVSLDRYVISGRGGREAGRPLPPVSLPPRGFLLIHVAQGADSLGFATPRGDYYTQDREGALLWNPAQDEVALYSVSRILDFLAWSSGPGQFEPGLAHNNAVSAGIWRAGSFLPRDDIASSAGALARTVNPGFSIGRNAESADTDSPFDFDAAGGPQAFDNNPGRSNLDLMSLPPEEAEAAAALEKPSVIGQVPPMARWTVMLYMSCEFARDAIEKHCLKYLEDMAAQGGSNASVNYVALFDRSERRIRNSKGDVIDLPGALRGHIVKSGELKPFEVPLRPRQPKGNIHAGVLNLGDPGTLTRFIADTVRDYRAERYAIIFVGHGFSWKGMLPDDSGGGRKQFDDRLYMGELSAGLAGGPVFDLIVFNSCLMGGVEVAHQIAANGRYLVASEEVLPADTALPFKSLVRLLNSNPQATGKEAGEILVRDFQVLENAVTAYTLSLIDLSKVADLTKAIDAWSKELLPALAMFQNRLDPTDNVQVLVRKAREAATTFKDTNFVDLYHLTELIRLDGDIPGCAKSEIRRLQEALRTAVVAQKNSHRLQGKAGGLHIYFPLLRSGRRPALFIREESRAYYNRSYYDLPETRESDADSERRVYARNNDQLPLAAREDDPPNRVLNPRTEWPMPPTPGLLFVRDTAWSRALERYYHPVADAAILPIPQALPAPPLTPVTVPGIPCEDNSYDYIVVPIGATVSLSAFGSTDVDMVLEPGSLSPQLTPYEYLWDHDDREEKCLNPPCLAPTQIDEGDTARLTQDNADQDLDPGDTKRDDRNGTGINTQVTCAQPGVFFVTLHVFDDNHLWSSDHDNSRGGAYVHTQTSLHQAQIRCGATTGVFGSSGSISYNQTGDLHVQDHAWTGSSIPPTQFLTADDGGPVAVVSTDNQWLRNYPVFVTAGPGIKNLDANGIRVPDGQERLVYTDAAGVMRTVFVNGDPPTGRLRMRAVGFAEREIAFPIVPRLAPLPDEVIVRAPAGPLTVGRDVNLIVEARRGGQPLRDAVVTYWTPTGTVQFVSGALFRRDTATQVRTAANGQTFAAFHATANGPVEIELVSGTFFRTVSLQATGGPAGPPTRLEVTEAPEVLRLERQATVRVRVLAQRLPLANVPVRIEVQQGSIVPADLAAAPVYTFNTNSQGEVALHFRPADDTSVQLRVTVPGTQLFAVIYLPVGVPSR